MVKDSRKNANIGTEEANRIISEAAADIALPAPPTLEVQKVAIAQKINDPLRTYWAIFTPRVVLGFAAVIMVPIVILVVGQYLHAPPEYYETGPGVQEVISLSDGSTVELGGNSNLRVLAAYGKDHRHMELEGEAFFKVTKGKDPFRVETGATQVTVIGTQFNIHQSDKEVSVHVVEGVVAFASAGDNYRTQFKIHSGWTSSYIHRQGILPTRTFDTAEWLKRKKGIFLFNSEPLGNVVREFENHFAIHINLDPSLAEREVSGRLQGQKPEEILNLLAELVDAELSAHNDRFVLVPKPE